MKTNLEEAIELTQQALFHARPDSSGAVSVPKPILKSLLSAATQSLALQQARGHAGDCSIYMAVPSTGSKCDICNCGYFLSLDNNPPDELAVEWAKHNKAIADSALGLTALITSLQQDNERMSELLSLSQDSIRALQQANAELLKDKELLDILEASKREHYAHWGEDGWNNPSVSWKVSQFVVDGHYIFPESLSKLTVREVLAAMSTPKVKEGE